MGFCGSEDFREPDNFLKYCLIPVLQALLISGGLELYPPRGLPDKQKARWAVWYSGRQVLYV